MCAPRLERLAMQAHCNDSRLYARVFCRLISLPKSRDLSQSIGESNHLTKKKATKLMGQEQEIYLSDTLHLSRHGLSLENEKIDDTTQPIPVT